MRVESYYLTHVGGNDINLRTTHGRILPNEVLQPQAIEFSLIVDNIAQELDETFVIILQVLGGTFGPGANIRNRLEGIILDSDGKLYKQHCSIV